MTTLRSIPPKYSPPPQSWGTEMLDRICYAIADDVRISLALASSFMFALTFCILAFGVRP